MHPVDLRAPVSPISWDNIALRGVQAPTRSGRDGKRLNSTVYGYTFLLATLSGRMASANRRQPTHGPNPRPLTPQNSTRAYFSHSLVPLRNPGRWAE